MGEYCSFFVVEPEICELIQKIWSGTEGSLKFLPDPSRRFWFTNSGMQTFEHPSAVDESRTKNQVPGNLLVVDAEEETAMNMIQLIYACGNVIHAFPELRSGMPSAVELPRNNSERAVLFENVFRTDPFFKKFTYRDHFAIAVAMAEAAWPDRLFRYAIHKLSRSYEEECVTFSSLHPRHGQIFDKHTTIHSEHVTTSVAINLAFSAIEELHLKVNSSSSKKRFTNSEMPKWNPVVLMDIKNRLSDAGIDPDETVEWIVRGEPTEPKLKPELGFPSRYSSSQVVRDLELKIPDALHYCSYIRNYMTAHAFSDKTTLLGPYEVFNVQHVARCLILSKSNLMRVDTCQLRNKYSL